MSIFFTLVANECHLAWRRLQDTVLMLGFALVAISLLAITTEPQYLQQIAPGTIWTVVLFSLLLTMESVWSIDAQSGRLSLLLSQPIPRWILVLAKATGFWLRAGLPLILAAPIGALLLQLPTQAIINLMLGLALGTPSLCLLATIGGCLTLGARQQTLLLMVIVLPLLIPVLIFGALGLERTLMGFNQTGSLLWLAVCLCLSSLCLPFGAMALHRPH